MSRPALTPSLAAADFLAYYWLRQELADFCRQAGLPATGAKTDLTARIATFLRGEPAPPTSKVRLPATLLPAALTLATRIEPGWRCSQALRAFFAAEVGSGFRFNQALRDFIGGAGVGRTLAEALAAWRAAEAAGPVPIAPQFEYNQFTRTYYQEHPKATAKEVRAAWHQHRSQRRAPAPSSDDP